MSAQKHAPLRSASSMDSRDSSYVDAGGLINGYSLSKSNVELFAFCRFISRCQPFLLQLVLA